MLGKDFSCTTSVSLLTVRQSRGLIDLSFGQSHLSTELGVCPITEETGSLASPPNWMLKKNVICPIRLALAKLARWSNRRCMLPKRVFLFSADSLLSAYLLVVLCLYCAKHVYKSLIPMQRHAERRTDRVKCWLTLA